VKNTSVVYEFGDGGCEGPFSNRVEEISR